MNNFKGNDFNTLYKQIAKKLLTEPEYVITNRTGEKLHELTDVHLELTNINNCYAFCRDLNTHYLAGELLFYLKGKNLLKNIELYSSFWKTISDDGVKVNSCYGYYIWNASGYSNMSKGYGQYGYVLKQLKNNSETKKAVLTIYDGNEHSKKSEDNPCTMFLQFYIRNNKLFLATHMRSNDVWFGITYDLPFFCLLQKMVYFELLETYPKLCCGSYIHITSSLHVYQKDFENLKKSYSKPSPAIPIPMFSKRSKEDLNWLINYENELNSSIYPFHKKPADLFTSYIANVLYNGKVFRSLKTLAKKSTCIKKQVACVFMKDNIPISDGWSGRPEQMGPCKTCVRDNEEFFQDGCNSLHSEERAILRAAADGRIKELQGSICFITHAPCDQCLKFLITVGCSKVVFEKPYKTHFERYKGIIEIEDIYGRKYV